MTTYSQIALQLDLKAGDTLVAYIEEDKLVLEKNTHIKRKLKGRFAGQIGSLADELIQEWQQAVQREGCFGMVGLFAIGLFAK